MTLREPPADFPLPLFVLPFKKKKTNQDRHSQQMRMLYFPLSLVNRKYTITISSPLETVQAQPPVHTAEP